MKKQLSTVEKMLIHLLEKNLDEKINAVFISVCKYEATASS